MTSDYLEMVLLSMCISVVQWIEHPRLGDWDYIASNTNLIMITTFFSFTTELKIGHLFLLL